MPYLYSSLVTAALSYLAYLFLIAVYRLYFHPLARFPGPKYAALSRWHEYYYDVHLKGKFIFHIQDLHKKYGAYISPSRKSVRTILGPNLSIRTP